MNWMLPDSSSHKATLGSAGPGALAPRKGMPPPENSAEVPLNWKLRLPHWAYGNEPSGCFLVIDPDLKRRNWVVITQRG